MDPKQNRTPAKPSKQRFIREEQIPDGFITPNMLQATTTIAKGDIYYVDANGKFTRLPIGTVGQKLTVTSTGLLTWA